MSEYSEEWRAVEELGGGQLLKVSNRGRVKCATTGKLMRPSCTKAGFHVIRVRLDGKRVGVTLHRLVTKAFLEGTPTYPVIFKDGKRGNCDILNLRWALPGEQELLQKPTGDGRSRRRRRIDRGVTKMKRSYGAKPRTHKPNTKLTAEQARDIRRRAALEPQKDLAVEFGVSKAAISNIFNGKAWPDGEKPE